MTQLGLDYLRNRETERSNRANERETNRANLAKEAENLRHNTATEQQAINELAETNRHNVKTESLEDIKNQATKEHYERQDANTIKAANISAEATKDKAMIEAQTKLNTNLNDNQTKRMTELTKLLPKSAQWAVAKAYAKEDPVYAKNFEKASGVAKDALVKIALGVAAPGLVPAIQVSRSKYKTLDSWQKK